MIKITAEIDGKPVNIDNITDVITRTVMERAANSYADKLHDVRCPEHGTAPHLNIKYKSDGFTIGIMDSCCEALTETCIKKLQSE